jgi:hypothetical protein
VALPFDISLHMLRHASGFTLQYGSLVQGGKEFYAAGVGDSSSRLLPRDARQHSLDLLVHGALAGPGPELLEPGMIDEATEVFGC